MFTVSGRVYPISEIDLPRDKRPLMVASCGHFIMKDSPDKLIERPTGRRDYQLIYLHSGRMCFRDNGGEQSVTAGQILIYHPGEAQFYRYIAEDGPEAYWIHFSGGGVPEALADFGLSSKRVYQVNVCDEYTNIFGCIIEEIQLMRRNYRIMADTKLEELLCRMSRAVSGNTELAVPRALEVEQAVRLFRVNFGEPFNLAQYAASCHMSPCWFTRLFTRQMGASPQQYLTNVRLTRACELLLSGKSVGETGEMVGYQDTLYFSRIFKKYIGQSPSQYRKSVTMTV